MNPIDYSIEAAKRRNRWWVSISTILGLLLVSGYLIWLFLIQGYQFLIMPESIQSSVVMKVQSGLGKVSGHRLYTMGGNVTVSVMADKYITQMIRVDGNSAANLQVTLQPKPAEVSVQTLPSNQDTDWYVDQLLVQTGSQLTVELDQGHHTIEARHRFYQPKRIELTTEPAQVITESIELEKISGTVTLSTVGAGGVIHIDLGNGFEKVATPFSKELSGGAYPVQITKTGFEPIEDIVEITFEQPNPKRNYRLESLKGSITLNVQPAISSILLDGRPVSSSFNLTADVEHQLSIQAPGYTSYSDIINVSPGQKKELSVSLDVELGQVSFNSNVDADVYLEGKKIGDTSAIVSLQTLPKTLEFRKEGYRTLALPVTPSVERTKILNLQLLTEFEARRKEGKPLFASSLGIELQPIQGTPFTMGSPVNEPNRLRNEIQRDVNFSRRFWMSKHEITEAQFAAFRQTVTPSSLPVSDISWNEAAAFTNWLSEKEGLLPFYILRSGEVRGVNAQSKGYRLPTEAEWEFVAKQYKRSKSTQYVWGSQERLRDQQGNFADESLKGQQTFYFSDYQDGFAGKAPVGTYRPDRGGFYDLDGNVREWVHDFYSLTPSTEGHIYTDYLGVTQGEGHVVKGASFKIGRMKNLRASRREGQTEPSSDIGFRIARYED